MPISIVVPQLGESVAEGTVSKWLKQVGERVRKEEPLVEIQTDKINVEIPSPAEGVLESIVVPEGTTVLVGTEIGVLSTGGAGAVAAPAAAGGSVAAVAGAAATAVSLASAAPAPAPAAAPAAPARAPVPLAASRSAAGAPPSGGSVPAPAPGFASASQADGDSALPGNLSPAVRRLIREHNVSMSEIAAIRGTGIAGRVTRDDLLEYLKGRVTPPGPVPRVAPAAPAPASASAATLPALAPVAAAPAAGAAATRAPAPPAFRGVAPAAASAGPREEVVPFTAVRRLIAEHMVRAQHTAAHTHCFDEADMGAIVALRRERASALEAQGVHLTYMPFFIKAAVLALREFPSVNAEVRGETMVIKRYYNIGVAVGREDRGLIVPNLKDCDRKSLVELAAEVNDLAARARADRLQPDDIAGGTFSITNAGVYGALNSAPVINVPEVAILGVHKIADRPVARDGQVVIRPMMNLAIGFDHRVVDGELAVKFLRRVCELLERPELLWFYA
jgi:pyruvate/2-oxoglutarate dehydrogenase complex dihydrolipoamide acyltransferase (E2) component